MAALLQAVGRNMGRVGRESRAYTPAVAPFEDAAEPRVTTFRTEIDTPLPAPGVGRAATPHFVARARPDGVVAFASEGLLKQFGSSPDAVVGQPLGSLVRAEDRPEFEAALASLSPQNRSAIVRARIALPQAPEMLLRWTLMGLFDDAGSLVEVQAFARDFSRELQIETDSARLAAIVAGADDAIISKDLRGTITSWNTAAEAMFGYTAQEAVGHSIALIIPEERLHEEATILSRLARGERTEHFETVRRRKDGQLITVSVNVSPIRDANGTVIGASKIARDITAQKQGTAQLEATVRNLEALYRLVESVSVARTRREVCEAALDAIANALGSQRSSVLLFDAAGVMRFTAWRGLSDRYRLTMDGHSPWKRDAKDPDPILVEDVLLDPAMAALRAEIGREGIRALGFIPLVFQGRLLGKFRVYFEEPRRLAAEERRMAATIARHVSFGLARVDAEAALEEAFVRESLARAEAVAARALAEQANQTKDEFLAMLSHELRNPLGVVLHAVQILAEPNAAPGDHARSISMIDRQSRHLASLLDDLLDVARITSGRVELRSELVDLRSVVQMAIDAQRLRVDAKQQRVALSRPAEPVPVYGDPVRLQQAVGNLVHNASKYSGAGAPIEVSVATEEREAVIRVRDEGAGIPVERLDAIFDLFVQANPTLARTEGGLGIGLTLVKRIVEMHEGRIEARSAGVGKGSEFEIRLPVAEAEPGELPVRQVAAPREVRGQRILVVEDNVDGREALVTLLGLLGHEAIGAASGREAIVLAGERRPEIAFLDIGLPDMDGYEVARELRKALAESVRLVAVTGYGQATDRERSRDAGFDAHLVKPVDADQIGAVLARFG